MGKTTQRFVNLSWCDVQSEALSGEVIFRNRKPCSSVMTSTHFRTISGSISKSSKKSALSRKNALFREVTHVALVRTDVSEEHTAYITNMKRIGEL
jgi:hypothetical protein